MKPILFSTRHANGHPTNFPELIWAGISQISPELYTAKALQYSEPRPDDNYPGFNRDLVRTYNNTGAAKYHTIRAGNHWKPGQFFAPRFWSGLPYRSKQFEFAPPIEIVSCQQIEISIGRDRRYNFEVPILTVSIDGVTFCDGHAVVKRLANNDGLSLVDFKLWFSKAGSKFVGQIICWHPKLHYPKSFSELYTPLPFFV